MQWQTLAPTQMIGLGLYWLLMLYFWVLIIRMVLDWVLFFNRSWRPTGPILVLANLIYALTDPPLRFLRRFLPPLRLGAVALDIAYMGLFLAVVIAQRLVLFSFF